MRTTRFRSSTCRSARRATKWTHLLVDADCHSIDDIQFEISRLEQGREAIRTTLFAEPGRLRNRSWAQFCDTPRIRFCAVPRADDPSNEANDQTIISRLRCLAGQRNIAGIVLMTSDTDYLGPLLCAKQCGQQVAACIPERHYTVVKRYQRAGIRVHELPAQRRKGGSGPKVRAVLHADGTGSIHTAESYCAFDNSTGAEVVRDKLRRLGFDCFDGTDGTSKNFLLQSAAKFWYSNKLGPLTVFPSQLATLAVHDVLVHNRRLASFNTCQERLAFLLPVSATRRSKPQEYGNSLARTVYFGGGPCVLDDDDDLTARCLRKLGYENHNDADLEESMLVFANTNRNKKTLRKLNWLPCPDDNALDVANKLRAAFLSHETQGLWQIASTDSSYLRVFLRQEGCLHLQGPGVEVSCEELKDAMLRFSAKHHLPPMRTLQGLAWQVLRRVNHKDPAMTSEVGFVRSRA